MESKELDLKGRKLDLKTTLKVLRKKRDCLVNEQRKVVYLLSGKDRKHKRKNDIGNKAHGRIDYLKKEHGYQIVSVDKL